MLSRRGVLALITFPELRYLTQSSQSLEEESASDTQKTSGCEEVTHQSPVSSLGGGLNLHRGASKQAILLFVVLAPYSSRQ
jgi:hypothetical protein